MKADDFQDLNLDHQSSIPLYEQLYSELKQRILQGRLASGSKLPSSRQLMDVLGVGRNTIVSALEQLVAEGYLVTKKGAGTFVQKELPDDVLRHGDNSTEISPIESFRYPFSDLVFGLPEDKRLMKAEYSAFSLGLPSLPEFPHKHWRRLWQKYEDHTYRENRGYQDHAGFASLRSGIAEYLRSSRACHCRAEQILITSGAQQGLDLIARLFINPGDPVVIEEPGYIGARRALQAAGAHLIPVPLDRDGLSIEALKQINMKPKLIYVTPSHQYPMGMTMPIARRLELLEWASANQCVVIEDDYDGEFYFNKRRVVSLQGLDKKGCVVYLGSFSKVLYPALRLGYLLLPESLVDVVKKLKSVTQGFTHWTSQVVVADFIESGAFSRHLKKMRMLYQGKYQILEEAIKTELPDAFNIDYQGAGMHTVLSLPKQIDDQLLAQSCLNQNIILNPLTDYYLEKPMQKGLCLGFACAHEEEIADKISCIAALLEGKEWG